MIPLAADRAITWCCNDEEKSSLCLNRKFVAKVKPWSIYSHWEQVQVTDWHMSSAEFMELPYVESDRRCLWWSFGKSQGYIESC